MKIILLLLSLATLSCGQGMDKQTVEEMDYPVSYWSAPNRGWSRGPGGILKDGNPVKLKGVNWFGFETPELVVHGLWSGRSMDSFLAQVKSLGFNALRVPLSPEVFEPGFKSSLGKESPLENLKDLLTKTKELGINVLLDLHTCRAALGLVGSPLACEGYTKESWHRTLVKMTELSLSFDHILGIDLFNEPYKLSWSQWQALSSEAATKVLEVNPNVLVFVEGVGNQDTSNGGFGANWGGNLVEAKDNPPKVPASQLVYSPHTYGPSVAGQEYFEVPSFPSNLPMIWDIHFGYLVERGETVVLGEFGGRYTGKDQVWQDALVRYLGSKRMTSFFYWSLNPNSGDTGGILLDDWQTVDGAKMKLLEPLLKE